MTEVRYCNRHRKPVRLPDGHQECRAPHPADRQARPAGAAVDLNEFLAEDVSPEEAFWQAREHFTTIRTLARSRMVSPWATLGGVLALVCTRVGPHVVLPPIVGGFASLNTFFAMVGESGGGKDAAFAVSREAVYYDGILVPTHEIGSGQGIDSSYTAQFEGETVQFCDSALFTATEIDQLAAHAKMSGSTVMATLRKVYSGAALGARYATKEKQRPVPEHCYRAAVIAGVQPARSAILLDDADGGTPQRWVWLPVNDPDAASWTGPPPAEHAGSLWTPTQELIAWGDQGAVGVTQRRPVEFKVCDTARQAIVAARMARLTAPLIGDEGNLDGHALLTRLKVAALLALLDRSQAEVNEEDWELAGTVMAVSNTTRAQCAQVLADRSRKANIAKALQEIERADVVADAAVTRVAKALSRVLVRSEEWITGSALRRDLPSRDREYFGPAVSALIAAERIHVDESDRGVRYRYAVE